MSRERTRFSGVYARTSATRKHRGKPDVCYDISFKAGDRKVWEKVGWLSEGTTAAYASQVRAERLREVHRGNMPVQPSRSLTFAQGFERYRADHLSQIKGERVVGHYNARLKDVFGHRKLGSITAVEVEQFKRDLLAEGLSPATVRHYVGTIGAVFSKLQDWGLFQGRIPTAKVDMPRKDNRRIRFLTRDEAGLLLMELSARSEEVYSISLVSLHSGMRFGEIAALRGEHVDVQVGTMRVVDGKNGHSRTAFMTQDVRALFGTVDLAAGQLVFPAHDGGVRKMMSRTFSRTVDDLGLNDGLQDARDRVVFHSLRHTYASWLVQQGVPLYTVGELLGHSSLEMTKRYAHLAPDTMRAAVQVFEGVWAG